MSEIENVRAVLPGNEAEGFGIAERLSYWSVNSLYSDFSKRIPPGRHEDFEAFRADFHERRAALVAHRFADGTPPGQGLMFEAWTADPATGTTRGEIVRVREDDLPEIAAFVRQEGTDALRARFGWALGDNLHGDIRLDAGWSSQASGFATRPADDFCTTWVEPSWEAFLAEWEDAGISRNVIFDWRVVPTSTWPDDSGHAFPERFELEFWMAMPGKEVDRAVIVKAMTRDDVPSLRDYLRRNVEVLVADCDWSKGIPEPDLGPPMLGPR